MIWNFYAGLRGGELSGLMCSDVDFKRKCVKISREVIIIQKEKLEEPVYQNCIRNGDDTLIAGQEDRKWVYVLVQHTKTNQERIVDLPECAVELQRGIQKTSFEGTRST